MIGQSQVLQGSSRCRRAASWLRYFQFLLDFVGVMVLKEVLLGKKLFYYIQINREF